MNMKQLIAIARERGVSYQMNTAELTVSLGFPLPAANNPLATLPPSPGMPVRILKLIAKGRGYKYVYLMNRAKLYEVLGIPPPETTDISVCKLRLMAREKGFTQPHLIRKAELFKLLGMKQPPTTDLRAIRCISLPVRKHACTVTVVSMRGGGVRRSFPSISVAAKATGIDRATLTKMHSTGHSHKGCRIARPGEEEEVR
jgi:hypothetical protein